MAYPTRLLPQPNFHIIKWRDELNQHFLLRSVSSANFIDAETGKVRAKYVNDGSREQLKDYSTNLLGVFLPSDAAIQLAKSERKSYLTEAWTEKEVVVSPVDNDFYELEAYGYFFYRIEDIQNFPQPFSIANQPDYVGNCYVLHTPTRSNFWHFSVRWKIGEHDIEQALTESQRRNLLGLVRSFLIERAIVSLPDNAPVQIEESWYKTQTT
jgi:hypothetical protein